MSALGRIVNCLLSVKIALLSAITGKYSISMEIPSPPREGAHRTTATMQQRPRWARTYFTTINAFQGIFLTIEEKYLHGLYVQRVRTFANLNPKPCVNPIQISYHTKESELNDSTINIFLYYKFYNPPPVILTPLVMQFGRATEPPFPRSNQRFHSGYYRPILCKMRGTPIEN